MTKISSQNIEQNHHLSHMKIDTLKYSEIFQEAGFDKKQAKILAYTLSDTTEEIINAYEQKEQITRKDIRIIEKEIKLIEENIRKDIKIIEENIRKEIKIIEKEIVDIKLSIEKNKTSILQWVATMFIGQTAILIATILTINKLSG
jgi:CRISPR/Cas system-associated exonuclease Cas4 (RecB family)